MTNSEKELKGLSEISIKYGDEEFILTEEMIDFTSEGEVFLNTLRYMSGQITKDEYNSLLSWEELIHNKYRLTNCYLSDTNLEKIKKYYLFKTELLNESNKEFINEIIVSSIKSNNIEVFNAMKKMIEVFKITNKM